jgi:hypothetical protein
MKVGLEPAIVLCGGLVLCTLYVLQCIKNRLHLLSQNCSNISSVLTSAVIIFMHLSNVGRYSNSQPLSSVTEFSNFVRVNTSWEAASCVVVQVFSNILWNPKVHYRVRKSPPQIPTSQTNRAHTTPSFLSLSLSLSILILTIDLPLCLSNGLFPSGFSH